MPDHLRGQSEAAGHQTPLVRDGRIVGAIGVSTGTIQQDQAVAEAGAVAL